MKKHHRNNLFLKLVALCLAMCLAIPCYAAVAPVERVELQGVNYFDSYYITFIGMGGGRVDLNFYVSSMIFADELGLSNVVLYESINGVDGWSTVRIYEPEDCSWMLGHNTVEHNGTLSYYGVAGRYYRAFVTYWVGNDGQGDFDYEWTPILRAF